MPVTSRTDGAPGPPDEPGDRDGGDQDREVRRQVVADGSGRRREAIGDDSGRRRRVIGNDGSGRRRRTAFARSVLPVHARRVVALSRAIITEARAGDDEAVAPVDPSPGVPEPKRQREPSHAVDVGRQRSARLAVGAGLAVAALATVAALMTARSPAGSQGTAGTAVAGGGAVGVGTAGLVPAGLVPAGLVPAIQPPPTVAVTEARPVVAVPTSVARRSPRS